MENKSIGLFILTLILFCAFSCSKDSSNDFSAEMIQGTWFLIELERDCPGTVDDDSDSYDAHCNSSNCFRWTFNNDGTVELVEIYGTSIESLAGTWSDKNGQLEVCVDGDCQTISVDIDDDEMTWDYVDEDSCEVTFDFVR